MNHILYVDTAAAFGGAEMGLLELMGGLDRQVSSPTLLVTANAPLEEAALDLDIPVFRIEFPWFSRRRPWRYAGSIGRLAALVRRQEIDLVHAHCDHSLRYIMVASKLTGVPYVAHVHDFVRAWFQPPQLAALVRASRVIANSESTAQACRDAGVAYDKVETVYNSVNLDAFARYERTEDAKQLLGFPRQATVIGLVGQVQPIKGHEEFVAAALSIVADTDNVYCLIVGAPHGADNDRFLERLQSDCKGWSERIRFLGFRSDVAAVMSAIDILAVPSWTEAFGRVAVEGMAAGCAVIATSVGGLPEIINDGHDGLLIPSRDHVALERAIRLLLDEPTLRAALAANGKRSAQLFSVSTHVSRMQEVYTRVLRELP